MIIKGNRLRNIKIKALLIENEDYEIYRSLNNAAVLIVTPKLYGRWATDNLFFNADPFKAVELESKTYYWVSSEKQFQLDIVRYGNVLCNRHAAVTFAFVLKQMRKVTDVSLYDGIYIEEYGYIVPTYSNETLSDDALLGSYFSGGRIRHFSDGTIGAFLLDENVFEEVSQITGIERVKELSAEKKGGGDKSLTKFTLAGRPELEKFFNEHIVNILNEPERYKKLGVDFPSSVILYGPPGCGKTYAVDRLVEFLDIPKFEINSATIASPYIHDTSKKISAVFENAIQNAPSVVVIDEMESYLSHRDSINANSSHLEEVAEFLRQIQQAQQNKVLIIAMTNMYDKIDPAVLRRGRFDHHVEVGLPSKEEIFALLQNLVKNISLSGDVNLDELADKLIGKTLADVAFIVKEAGLISGKKGDDNISNASLLQAVDTMPKEKERGRLGFYEKCL
ncbi:MAG: ATP-binding protein [Clostridiales bacterium]|jgi:hypothetical protein|nr:ATP-binding protein [Clostridiales bacterium]